MLYRLQCRRPGTLHISQFQLGYNQRSEIVSRHLASRKEMQMAVVYHPQRTHSQMKTEREGQEGV